MSLVMCNDCGDFHGTDGVLCARGRLRLAEARVAELETAIGTMVPTIIRSFLEVLPPEAVLDREVATATLARVDAAMAKRPGLSVRVAEPRKAAVALIQREDGRVLCAWNLRYNGFSLPGGMVEDGETTDAALRRELREETSCEVATSELIFEGEHNLRPKTGERGGRASIVALYRVTATGEPRETEPGCRVEWLTWDEFLDQSPFGAFYRAILPSGPRPSEVKAGPRSRCRSVVGAAGKPLAECGALSAAQIVCRDGYRWDACAEHAQGVDVSRTGVRVEWYERRPNDDETIVLARKTDGTPLLARVEYGSVDGREKGGEL